MRLSAVIRRVITGELQCVHVDGEGCPQLSCDRLTGGFQGVRNTCDFPVSYFLDFYQDGLQRLAGNEYVLSTKSKFFLFNFLDCY